MSINCRYVTRININGGNTLEQIGPSKFARLNGVAGFKKSTVKTGNFTFSLHHQIQIKV